LIVNGIPEGDYFCPICRKEEQILLPPWLPMFIRETHEHGVGVVVLILFTLDVSFVNFGRLY
jgi:hypothetical protein